MMPQVETPRNFTDEQARRLLRWLQPTPRERWEAFWRLYRALRRKCIFADDSISYAACVVLQGDCLSWYHAMRCIENGYDPYTVPRFLRDLLHRLGTSEKRNGNPHAH